MKKFLNYILTFILLINFSIINVYADDFDIKIDKEGGSDGGTSVGSFRIDKYTSVNPETGKEVTLYCRDAGLLDPATFRSKYSSGVTVNKTTLDPTSAHDAGLIELMQKGKNEGYSYESISIAVRFYEYMFQRVDIYSSEPDTPEVKKNIDDNILAAERYISQWMESESDFKNNVTAAGAKNPFGYTAYAKKVSKQNVNDAYIKDTYLTDVKNLLLDAISKSADAATGKLEGGNTKTSITQSYEPSISNVESESEYIKVVKHTFSTKGFNIDKDSILMKFTCTNCDQLNVKYELKVNGTVVNNKDYFELIGTHITSNEATILNVEITFRANKNEYDCTNKVKYSFDFKYTGDSNTSKYAQYETGGSWSRQVYIGDEWTEEEGSDGISDYVGEDGNGNGNDKKSYPGKFNVNGSISLCEDSCETLKNICEDENGNPLETNNPKCEDYEEECKKQCTVYVSTAKCPTNSNGNTGSSELEVYEGSTGKDPCTPAPINVYKCVIDGKDLNDNEYNQEQLEADNMSYADENGKIKFIGETEEESNPFCKVACIENFNIELPVKKETTAGRYFTIETKIAGNKSCYTSEIKNGEEDDPYVVEKMTDEKKKKKEQESFKYKFEVSREKMIVARTLASLYKGIEDGMNPDKTSVTKTGPTTNENETHNHPGACYKSTCNIDEMPNCDGCEDAGKDACDSCQDEISRWKDESGCIIHDTDETKYPKYYTYKFEFSYTEYDYTYSSDRSVIKGLTQNYFPKLKNGYYGSDGNAIKDDDAKELKGTEIVTKLECNEPSNGEVKCKVEVYGKSHLVQNDDEHEYYADEIESPQQYLQTIMSAEKGAMKTADEFRNGFDSVRVKYLKDTYPANFDPKSLDYALPTQLLAKYKKEMDKYVTQINQCSHWTMGDYHFNPEVEFDYEESYIDDALSKKLVAESGDTSEYVKAPNIQKCGDLLVASDENGELPTCENELITQNQQEKRTSVLVCASAEADSCSSIQYIFPQSKAASQQVEVERNYITRTQYGVLLPSGNVIVPSGGDLYSMNKTIPLQNAWPVEWGKYGVFTYKLYVKDLGEFYNEKEGTLGRIWDSGASGDPIEESNVGKVVSDNLCTEGGSPSGKNESDIVPGSNEYICQYNINCPNCPSECDPSEGECKRTDCPNNDCPSPCDGICIYNGDLKLESRPISESKINTSDRTDLSPNWKWDTNIDTALELKAYKATKDIETAGEDIFNVDFDASYEGSTTIHDTGQMIVHLDRKTINEIKKENKDTPYSNDSLECYGYSNGNEHYEGIFCYSTWIDKYIDKGVIKVSGDRPTSKEERANNSKEFGYWTTWDEVVSSHPTWESDVEVNLNISGDYDKNFKSIGIGPAYK